MQASLQRVVDSILAADVGSVWTRVILVDRVDGAYRFVAFGDAPSTAEPPYSNVLLGVRAAIQEIEANTGRHLLDEQGNLITPEGAEGRGVDLFLATSSAATPLRVAVGGLVERVSAASARRAARGTYSTLTHSFALDAPEGHWGHPRGHLGVVEQLLGQWPDAIVLAGGTEGSAEQNLLELAEAIRVALRAAPDRQPPAVVFAGNSELHEAMQARLGGSIPLMLSENLRPTLRDERLRLTARLLDHQFRQRCLGRIPGGGALRAWSNTELIPTAEAFNRVVQYLALRPSLDGGVGGRRVLGVDVGGSNATLAVTFENRVSQTLVRTDLGLLSGVESLLEHGGRERLAAWVPGLTPPGELANEYANFSLFPAQQPLTVQALRLLQGAAREIIRLLLTDAVEGWPPGRFPGLTPLLDVLLGTGSVIRHAPRPEQAMAILLDGVQPTGITHVLRDRLGLSAAIGALADVAPHAAADLIESQGFESLGIAVTPVGRGQPGDEVLRFHLSQGQGSTEGVVEYGQSYRFPTPEETRLDLRPARGFDIGLGPGVGTTLTRAGDSVGFVIDARGRPLVRAGDLEARRAQAEEWLRYVGA